MEARIFYNITFRDLSAEQTMEALEALPGMPNVKRAAVHDFMHARTAEYYRAESIVTLNLSDFSRMT